MMVTPLSTEGVAGTIARLGNLVGMDERDRGECVTRFHRGEQTYGYGACLRRNDATTCWACGQPKLAHFRFCPACGKPVDPYRSIQECREEMLDAFNQVAMMLHRGERKPDSEEIMLLAAGIVAGLTLLRAMDAPEDDHQVPPGR